MAANVVGYKSLKLRNLNNAETVYYTCPANTVALITTIFAVCTSDTEASAFDTRVDDLYLCRTQPLPIANPFELTEDQPIILTVGETLKFKRSADGPCDVYVAIMEQTEAVTEAATTP